MKIKAPQPFTFESGKRAVLLLHGFTGNTADVRMLGRFLEKNGYTCHAPQYKGHGVPPEELVQSGPKDWWADALGGYEFLKERGYDEIAVAGLSLGGVFSLKLGYTVPVKGIVPMCAPMYIKDEEFMYERVLDYAREYKRLEGKSKEQIETEMDEFREKPMKTLKALWKLNEDVRSQVDMIYAPLFVVQARHDGIVGPGSAEYIYEQAESIEKNLKWYEHSGHVITLDAEKEQLHEDVLHFLEGLDWTV
ncbi:alpha/beta fold hydrolase [Siminovitchia acidinfaciens]|uniref:Carboxylesterase n=1 Tax=Siminovitchia acidinfaciens TaxID=2321395 RepID=A0A429Y862_9BACI|nr:carboxylesterase [Siminovitchia acidinfaciens]RST77591.1 alpha/beta fold hydrolase [Siminovitchia acidinfaciens]